MLALITLGCCLLDLALLTALPWLGLSFGPLWFTVAALWGTHLTLWLVAEGMRFLPRLFVRRQDDPLTSRRPALKSPVGLAFLLLNVFLLGCVIEAFYREPFDLRVTELQLPAPALAPGKSLRIVQLADLHVERLTRRERALIPLVESLHPDLIVMTGDYLNLSYLHDPTARRDLRDLLAQLHAPYGIYAVDGTVENPAEMGELFAGLEIITLDDERQRVTVDGSALTLVGVSNLNWRRDAEALRALMAQTAPTETTLLLYHTPDLAEVAAATGVDLYLAGHTHGGQVRLPVYGAIITLSRFGKRYEAGRYTVGPTTLYVSRGIGMEGAFAPRARFLCPPEVLVLDLVAPGTVDGRQ